MWFLYTLFPQDFSKKLFQTGLAISSIFWIICLATPLKIYSQTVAPFQVFTLLCIVVGFYGLAKAVFHRRPGALVMIAGCILLTATVINDILHSARLINTSYIIGFGIYALVFSQSVVLATIFSKAFRDVEIGQKKIKRLNRQLEDHIINLDAIVDEKTREIRSIMTHIQQGICLVEGEQVKVSSEYSKHMEQIAGSQDIAGQRLVDLIFQDSQISSDLKSQMHSTLHAAIGEDPIAFEANAHLLTHEFKRQIGSSVRTYEIDWNPIEDDQGLIDKFLVAIKDVTSLRTLQEESLQRQNELKLISEIINVPIAKFDSFIISCREFITENREAVARSSAGDREALTKMFRNMHTLKGAARSFSFDELAALAHDTETYYQQLRDQHDTNWNQDKLFQDLDAVEKMIEIYARINAEKLGRSQEETDAIIIDRDIVEENMARLSRMDLESFQDGDRDLIIDLKQLFNNLVYNPLNKVLEEQIHSLGKIASDLGKANPILRIEDPGISFTKPAQELMIRVFTHMFRNSLDHGIELPDFRQNHGKEAQGQLNIKMYLEHGQLKLEYWDDGAGLNLPLIKKTAIRKGLIQGNESYGALEIGEFIFHPGFSTKREVSEISGRGVGMDAMRGFLEDHNAQIDLWIDAAPDSKALGFVPCKFILTLPETYFDIISSQGNATAA
ncbi:Histidine kinase-, DNA gyrase B-, and HSP90-like ATPase [Pseudobacteriovorax antillogorgiicola]|uniref:Histidine kinase-, DNA gyrase B-, and HSP90-like ATPase n=2 Tax=Pseudobacteriovorax antillogorgiicola TaxID=1513793 RepID=A0A1Y6CJ30_9BACT|nr:Hpt domain-containing protein [Pseudobacteriovorax antillogorgiicola]TCS48291.1 histidine kinase/DNA gyrase B/HSP90-like ATPase [Pseudobacteriovorax antillogorgiicola]SMF56877.1 Histidine kinase-, DNA gyrase B-, and HSP90-like ATPase [Pseudobacteriovorax antillogorgiicola]